MYNGDIDIQKSGEGLFRTQEQSGCAQQARSFPQIKWQAC